MSQTPEDVKREELSQEELEAQSAEQLPEREAMSVIDPAGAGMWPHEPPIPD